MKQSKGKLIIAGYDCRQKQDYLEHAGRICSLAEERGISLGIRGENAADADEDSCVLFIGLAETGENLSGALSVLESLAGSRPAAVVLVTDRHVYGSCFGSPGRRKETELGYVCHTSGEESGAAGMRILEHMACELAKEGMHICVARSASLLTEAVPEEEIARLVKVLLQGEPGEAYNLSEGEGKETGVSPLSPVQIRLSTEKADHLSSL